MRRSNQLRKDSSNYSIYISQAKARGLYGAKALLSFQRLGANVVCRTSVVVSYVDMDRIVEMFI